MTSRIENGGGPRAETFAAIEAAIGASIEPVRPVRAERVALPVAAAAVVVSVAVIAFAARGELWASVVAAVIGVVAAYGVTAVGIRAGFPVSGLRRGALVAALAVGAGLAWIVGALFAPLSFDVTAREAHEWSCLAMTMGFSMLPAIVAALTLRRLYLWSWRRVVAVAFFATAVLGAVMAEVVCRSGEGAHFVLTHLTGIGVVAAIGAWVGGRRWFAR